MMDTPREHALAFQDKVRQAMNNNDNKTINAEFMTRDKADIKQKKRYEDDVFVKCCCLVTSLTSCICFYGSPVSFKRWFENDTHHCHRRNHFSFY